MTVTELKIRNLNPTTNIRLRELAKEKGMSLNAYLKVMLDLTAIQPEILIVEDKYSTLVDLMASLIKDSNTEIKLLRQELELLRQEIKKNER